jgi:hypothetical protein
VLCGFALIIVASTVAAVFRYPFFMPYLDSTTLWSAYLTAQDSGGLSALLLHGIRAPEQRVVPLIWIFLLDIWLVRGRGTVMIVGNLVLCGAALGAILWSRNRDADQAVPERAAFAGLVAMPVFSAIHIVAARPVFVAQYAEIAACFLAFVAAASVDRGLNDAGGPSIPQGSSVSSSATAWRRSCGAAGLPVGEQPWRWRRCGAGPRASSPSCRQPR